MCLEFALKKGGLPLIRNFLHSIQGVKTGLPIAVQKRTQINFKLKSYKDGKIINSVIIESLEDAFPCKGDKK